MPVPLVIEGAGLTAELLLFRAYGRRGNTSDMLDATTALNPGLAGLRAVLPLGTAVTLPDLPTAAPAVTSTPKAVNLFGD